LCMLAYFRSSVLVGACPSLAAHALIAAIASSFVIACSLKSHVPCFWFALAKGQQPEAKSRFLLCF
jgi:hypothetical protein